MAKGQARRDTDSRGYITIKAVHVWGPFFFQLAVLLGSWFTLQQKVADMTNRLDYIQSEIVELRSRLYK